MTLDQLCLARLTHAQGSLTEEEDVVKHSLGRKPSRSFGASTPNANLKITLMKKHLGDLTVASAAPARASCAGLVTSSSPSRRRSLSLGLLRPRLPLVSTARARHRCPRP